MKRMISLILTAAVCAALVSCSGSGDSKEDSAKTTTTAATSGAVPAGNKEQTGTDPDTAGFLFKDGTEDYFGLTIEEISEKSGGFYDLSTASDGDLEWGLEFDLGERESFMADRITLGGTYKLTCVLSFDDDKKLKSILYVIEKPEGAEGEAEPVTKELKNSIEAKLLDDYYPEYDRPALGKNSATYFNGSEDGYIMQFSCSSIDAHGFPIQLKIESYRSAYGL